jgi:hypothetical protein
MARNGVKSGGKNFEKGDPRINRKGLQKLPPDLHEASEKLSNHVLEAKLRKFLDLPKEQLKNIIKDPKTKSIDSAICAIISRAVIGADEKRLDWVITRLLGKVKEPEQMVTFRFDQMPDYEVIDLGKEAIKYLEARKQDDDTEST